MIQKFIKKLPAVLQTDVQKEFYSATFDQLFNPANVEQAQGFIGRKDSEIMNPLSDNYLGEPTKNRASYQLEPIAFAVNEALNDSNQSFYEDLLSYVSHRGGNILNHDRLFADLYYSFAPPIDIDKFLNYQNYLWLEDSPPIIFISSNNPDATVFDTAIEDNIIGATSFNTSTLIDFLPQGLELSSGMRVRFEGSASYDLPLYVECVGREIRLVKELSTLQAGSVSTFVPWDNSTGGIGELFDEEATIPGFDVTVATDLSVRDYITIERGSCEGSPWTRTNRWFHEDAVETAVSLGQLLDFTITNGGVGYGIGDVLIVNLGDGVGGSVTVTAIGVGGVVTDVRISGRGQGYSFATIDQTGVPSPIVGLKWDELPSGLGSLWDGMALWDDATLTVGAGSGVIIDMILASAVPKTNKARRPILEFRKDLELFDFGNKFLGEITVVAATEAFTDIQGQAIGTIVDGVALVDGMTLIFLEPASVPIFQEWDLTPAGGSTSGTFWDAGPWELEGASGAVTRFIWKVLDDPASPGVIDLVRIDLETGATGDTLDPVPEGTVVLATQGDIFLGDSFYQFKDSLTAAFTWQEGQVKGIVNKQPLFELYDTNGIRLSDSVTYPTSTYAGSEVYSYKVLTIARLQELGGVELINDIELGFPVETKGLRQLGDIIFENDLEAVRYQFTPALGSATNINGYYFFKEWETLPLDCTISGSFFGTNWQSATAPEKQRVIDRFLTESATVDTFKLSGAPVINVSGAACLVVAQGRRLNTDEFVYLAATNEMKLLAKPTQTEFAAGETNKVTFSFPNITQDLRVFIDGLFQVENIDYVVNSTSPFIITFAIAPAAGVLIKATQQASGAPGINQIVEILTYTFDLIEDSDLGYFEIPNELENNPNNLEIIEQSWNEFTPHYTSIITEQAVYDGTAFGSGNNFRDTAKDGSLGIFILQNQSPMLKTMLVTSSDDLDVIDALRMSSDEYTRFRNKYIKTAQQLIKEGFTSFEFGDQIPVSLWVDEIIRRITRSREFTDAFKDTYMIGWSNVHTEQIDAGTGAQTQFTLTNFVDLNDKRNVLYVYVDGVLQQTDTDYTITNLNPIQISFATPPDLLAVIVTRLYEDSAPAHIPATPSKLGMYPVYKPVIETDDTYAIPTNVIIGHDGSRTPTFGDQTDELLLELENRIYNGIINKFRINYTPPLEINTFKPGKFRTTRWTNKEFDDLIKQSFFKWAATNKADYVSNNFFDTIDKFTWNYNDITDIDSEILPGYWRGIFDHYYDTQTPATTPWEMLGFTQKPSWWELTIDLGDGFSGYGSGPWPSSHSLWIDLEDGNRRRKIDANGDAIIDKIDTRYARPNLVSKYIPVDSSGVLKTEPLLVIDATASLIDPITSQAQSNYTWTDLAPIEYAWRTSESYPFAVMEALFLARPSKFGEQLWDPEHLFEVPIDTTQIVNDDNDIRKRIGNSTLIVHGEVVDGIPQIQTGYQVWIAGRVRSLKKDLAIDFGGLLRSYDVKLGHKMASFTDKDTLRVFVEGISVTSQSTNLLVPSENINVSLYTSPPVREYVYGGVLIKALSNGEYQVFGYDILAGEFMFFPRVPSAGDIDITVGGQPEKFTPFKTNTQFLIGQIVRLNGIFYRATVTHVADKFDINNWLKLKALPITGGVSVTHRKKGAAQKIAISYAQKFSSVQQTFDFLVGYGEFLESEGWVFNTVNSTNNTIQNWLQAAKDFLFWVGTQWEADSIIMLSPSADSVAINVNEGYPANVEKVINGTYSILDKNGVSIDPINTTIRREDRNLIVTPNIEQTGIYGLRVVTKETENIITFDNITVFNDVIYDPLLGTRLARLDFTGRRTLDWTGKLEAAGFIITADGLLPNYENLVNSIRNYHNTEELLDNPLIESVAQHLIGYEKRDYFTNLGMFDDAAFQFYQGMLREKGTSRSIKKIERNKLVTNTEDELNILEEWALRLDSFAGVCSNQFTEFKIASSEVKVDPQLVQLSYPASQETAPKYAFDSVADVDAPGDFITIVSHGYRSGEPKTYSNGGGTSVGGLTNDVQFYVVVLTNDTFSLALTRANALTATPIVIDLSDGVGIAHTLTPFSTGTVSAIDVVSASNVWVTVPQVFITNHPDDITGTGATAVAVIDSAGFLIRIDVLTGGIGYIEPPIIAIGTLTITATSDRAVASIRFDIVTDVTTDDVIIIDIDDETRWITKPDGIACNIAGELWPDAVQEIKYETPNAGYVHLADIDFQAFFEGDIDALVTTSASVPSVHGEKIWVARDARDDFGVYMLDNYRASTIATQDETNFNGIGINGSFFGGTNYATSEIITMNDGSTILVDAQASGVITGFTITTASTSSFVARGDITLTVASSTSTGNDDFTLTMGVANEGDGSSLTTSTSVGATLIQILVTENDGRVVLGSFPREDVKEAVLTIDVDGTGGVTGVTLIDGGFGYVTGGTFTISRLTHGAERNISEIDAVITYGITNGVMSAPTITTIGTGYTRQIATAVTNATGSGYSIGDVLTITGGTGVLATLTINQLSTVGSQDETDFDNSPAAEGTFVGGTGHALGDVITMNDGSTVTVNAATVSTIAQQTDADYDNSPTSEGTFVGGSGYVVGDLMTMTDGTVVQVDSVAVGVIDGFRIVSASTSSILLGDTIAVLILPSSGGVNFTMTVDTDNVQSTTAFGVVTEFTVTTESTSAIITDEVTLVLTSTDGTGIDFTLTLGVDNQGLFEPTITTAGAYTGTLPNATAAATTVVPTGGTGITLDLTFIENDIPVNTADIINPTGWLRYMGNRIPNSGQIYADSTLYDYIRVSGTVIESDHTSLAFADNIPLADTITRTGGTSFTELGFAAGQSIVISSSENDGENNGPFTIASVTATIITLVDANVLIANTTDTTATIRHIPANEYILSKNGVPIADNTFTASSTPWFTLVNLRFLTVGERTIFEPTLSLINPTTVWTDDNGSGLWEVSTFTAPSTFVAARTESELIETDKFINAFVYEEDTKDTLAQIPVYDPFKGIIPGNADLNIKYKTCRDPARYTNASVALLIDEDLAFDGDQVGELWWDTSTSAYILYEQGTDTYRRDNWGTLFIGSSVDIYEWTRSAVTSALYIGDGTVRNITDFVELQEWDSILEEIRTFFYFWVKNRTEVPGVKNRTIAGFEVANIITNPAANLYQWFSPISQTAFMFSGVDGVFTDSDNVFQINYRRNDDEHPTHVEWELGRENDPTYIVNTLHWDKMVDSITGYTAELDIGAQAFTNKIGSFLSDATSVITSAPDIIVTNVIATFLTDVTGITSGSDQIGTVAPHGLTTGDSIVYSVRTGVENVGLTDGVTYFVNVLSTTTLSLHLSPANAIADINRVDVFVSGAETHALTSAVHGFVSEAAVIYSAGSGTVISTLVEGREYYVEPVTTTTLALHPTQGQAATANPGSRVDVIPAALAETHTLTETTITLNNFNNAIPTAADPSRGFLIVPDPELSVTTQLGIKTRPMQSMFLNLLPARRVFVNKINELVEDIILRDENPLWNAALTTNNLWSWVDWFAVGHDVTTVIPVRQVTDTSDLVALPNPLDGDIVKVTGTLFSMYEYSSATGLYTLVAREASRLQLNSEIYTANPTLATALELRELIEAIRTQVFINERKNSENLLFFAMLNYVFSEQNDVDWAFKTTYIFLDQTGQTLAQPRVFQEDPFDSALDYITEIKPYQTKIRDFRITRETELDAATGTASETTRNFTVDMVYDQVRGGDLSISEMRIAKREGGLSASYKGYSTLDSGATLVRLGAAGRFVNNQRSSLSAISAPANNGDNLADYDPNLLGPAASQTELTAIAAINTAMTTEFFFDYQGTTIQNTSSGGLPTLVSAVISVAGSGYLVGEILQLDAGSGVPVAAAQIRVVSIDGGGGITAITIVNGGSYQQTPTADPVLLNGGSGTLASVTTLIFQNAASVPFDSTPWDQIGFDSSAQDAAIDTLDGSPENLVSTIVGQNQTNFDNVSPNGTFVAGASYAATNTIIMSDGTDITVDAVSGGAITQFTISGSSITSVAPLSTLTQTSTSGGGSNFTLTLGAANSTTGTFTDVPAEESFTADGTTREFTIITTTPTFFMFVVVDGVEKILNVDYFFIGPTLVFITAPAATTADNIQLFTYIEAGDLINPQVSAGITEEMVPLDPRENLVVLADSTDVSLTVAGTGYAASEVLTITGGTLASGGAAMTITVDTVSGGVIQTFTVTTQGDYVIYPTNPVATTGSTNNDATFTIISLSFRIHQDTQQGTTTLRNDDSASTTLTAAIGIADTVIPVTDETLLEPAPTTRSEPNIAWIGTERIKFNGVNASANELTGVERGTLGTHAQAHANGTKLFAGGSEQEISTPQVYWVDSATAGYDTGTAGQWRYIGNGEVHFSDDTDLTMHTGSSMVVGDTLRVTIGAGITNSYFIKELILDEELSIIDVVTPGTGYSVGDVIDIDGASAGSPKGAIAVVGGVDVNGGIRYVTITNRGAGFTSPSPHFISVSGTGNGDAELNVYFDREGLVLAQTGDIIDPNGVIAEVNSVTWFTDRLLPGGLNAATTAQAIFIQAQSGNALPIIL